MVFSDSKWLDKLFRQIRCNKRRIVLWIIGALIVGIGRAIFEAQVPDRPITRLVNWYDSATYKMKKHKRFSVLVANLHRDDYDQKETKALARILSSMNAFDVEMPGTEIDPYQSTGVIGLNDDETLVKAQSLLSKSYCDVIVYGQCVGNVVELGFASRQRASVDAAAGKLETFKIDRLELQKELSDKLHGEFLAMIVSTVNRQVDSQFSFVGESFRLLLLKIDQYMNSGDARSLERDVALMSSLAVGYAICGQQFDEADLLQKSLNAYDKLLKVYTGDKAHDMPKDVSMNHANALARLGANTKDVQMINSAIDEYTREFGPESRFGLTITERVDGLVGKGVALLKKYDIEGTDIGLLQQSSDCFRYAMSEVSQLPEKSKAVLYLNYGVTLLKQGVVTGDKTLIQEAIRLNRLALAMVSSDTDQFFYYRCMFNLADCYKSMYAIEKYTHWLVSASKAYANAEKASSTVPGIRHTVDAEFARGLVGAQIAVKQNSDNLCALYSELLHRIAFGKFYPKNSYLYLKAQSSYYALQTYFAVMHNEKSMQEWLYEELHEISVVAPSEYQDINNVINDSLALLNRSAIRDFTVF